MQGGGGSRRVRAGWLAVLGLLVAVAGGGAVVWLPDRASAPTQLPAREPVPSTSTTGPLASGIELPRAAVPSRVAEPVARADAGEVSGARVRAALAPRVGDDDLGRRVAVQVAGLSDGEMLFRSGPSSVVPASTLKLVTATAALEVLGPERVFTTRVVRTSGNEVVLVGGGDPLLLSRPPAGPERSEVYPPRADLRTLAAATAAAWRGTAPGRRGVRLGYDASLFSGPGAAATWEPDYLPDGVIAPISALWVDQGRTANGLDRVSDPPLRAARVFAKALAAEGLRVLGDPSPALVPASAPLLASVDSAPLDQIVHRLVEVSDNETSEVLLRHLGLARGGAGSFEAGTSAMLEVLRELGVPLDGARVYDGSGLSRANRLDPRTLLAVLRLAADPARPELRTVLTGLPVAGFTGSLEERFLDSSAAGRGMVRAKTGTLTGVSGLAGLATGRDGATVVFVAVADRIRREDTLDARAALDDIAAALGDCACAR